VKPWEETWDWGDTYPSLSTEGAPPIDLTNDGRTDSMLRPYLIEVARLAACAPEMARMLLAIEWNGHEEDSIERGRNESTCPMCGALEMGEQGSFRAHRPDCAIDALLRKAGVR
jgi:hypothetical protein